MEYRNNPTKRRVTIFLNIKLIYKIETKDLESIPRPMNFTLPRAAPLRIRIVKGWNI